MLKKEELFYLIKSLNKSEVRYFKLQAGDKAKNYLRLFDEIRIQAYYDETAIKTAFAGEAFTKQLTATKYYLKKLILKALRNYESEKLALSNLLANVHLLYDKGLYPLCEQELKKAQELALQKEDFTSLYQIAAWKRKLTLHNTPTAFATAKENVNEQTHYLQQLQALNQVWHDNFNVRAAQDYPLQRAENVPISIFTLQQLVNSRKKMATGQFEEGLRCLETIKSEQEKDKNLLQHTPEAYLNTLGNLTALYIYADRYDAALDLLKQTKQFIKVQGRLSSALIKALVRAYNTELELYRNTQQLPQALQLIQEIKTQIDEHGDQTPSTYVLSFYFQFAYIHYLRGAHEQALSALNKIFDHPERAIRLDILTYSHWLNLIVHFELRNLFVLGYFVGATRRFLKKRRSILPYEKHLLAFFAKASKLPTAEIKPAFQKLQQQLLEQQLPERIHTYIDFDQWIVKNV